MDIGAGTTEGAGGKMVFCKVREVYDLETVPNKMTVISVHTPRPEIIKANFPGLLMQCKTYRPYSCDIRVACASTQPLDPLGVGTTEGAVSPEDLFNPILYKAMTNIGMSQLEARIAALSYGVDAAASADVRGQSASVDVDSITNLDDEFPVYYGLLSNCHGWRTADPQQGFALSDVRPLVYEMLYNIGDSRPNLSETASGGTYPEANGLIYPSANGGAATARVAGIRGNAKPLPMINCISYTGTTTPCDPGFPSNSGTVLPRNHEQDVPWINCCCAGIIIPPSRLHTLFFRMIIEWTLEFSDIRPISEITNWAGLGVVADISHYQNYSYAEAKKAITGTDDTILENDQCMVSSNVEVKKVM